MPLGEQDFVICFKRLVTVEVWAGHTTRAHDWRLNEECVHVREGESPEAAADNQVSDI